MVLWRAGSLNPRANTSRSPACPFDQKPASDALLERDPFMTKRLLIDARQSEETRVVLLSGTRIEDFDYETENRKQLKGNVYLARVTRVEPSLQAAFVEYGGNRQGFLAFSEIHPDYYRIPVADREALLAEQARSRRRNDDDDDYAALAEKYGVTFDDDDDSED